MLTFQAHGKEVLSLAFSPDGQRLATVSKEPNIRIWGETYDRPLLTCPCKTTVWAGLTFFPDGRHLDPPSRHKVDWFAAQQPCYSPDGAIFMLASHSQVLRRWRTAGWEKLPSF